MHVDLGIEGDKRKRPNLSCIVLSHSRKGYSEAVWRQRTEDFICCLEVSGEGASPCLGGKMVIR
jgi:hypothetical protein